MDVAAKEKLQIDMLVSFIKRSGLEYDYPTFHLSMDCFWAEVVAGRLVLNEAEDARWLTRETLESVQWLPADASLIEHIKASM